MSETNNTIDKNYAGTIILKCTICGGRMEVDKKSDATKCRYCGMSKLLAESDEAVIERIRSKTFQGVAGEKIQANKEVELTKLQLQTQEETEKKLGKIRKSPFTKTIAWLTMLSLFMAIQAYSESWLISAIFMGCQTLLFVIVWLMRMRLIKGAKIRLHSLFTILAFLLFIPYFMSNGVEYRSYDKYVWLPNNLATMLPKPQSVYGEIDRDTVDRFSMMVGKVEKSDFNTYVEECIEKGFTLKSDRTDTTYIAFHETWAELRIIFNAHLNEMDISVEGYQEFYEYTWTGRGLAALLPEPVSKLGIISSASDEDFEITVAETTVTDFNKYANACIEVGFAEDVDLFEDYFSAENSDGIRIRIEYKASDVMEIRVSTPYTP